MAQVHLNAGNVDKALGVFELMRSKNFEVSRFGLILLLKCYVVKEDLDSAEKTYNELPTKDSESCNCMLGLYMKLDLVEKSKGLIMQMRKDGFKFDEEVLKRVVKIYSKEGMVSETEELIRELRGKSGKSKLYKLIFEEYGKCSKTEEAYLFYRAEKEKGKNYEMGAVAISILVNNLTISGKYEEAKNVIRDCLHDKLELDTVAYNSFIKAMLIAGNLDFATSIFELMLSSGVSPSIRTFSTMISVYRRGRNLSKAVELFDIAEKNGVTLDEMSYINMISYHANTGQSRDAALLFSKMLKKGILKESITWAPHHNELVSALGKARLVEEAEIVYRKLTKGRLISAVGLNQSMMKVYVENRDVQRGISFFESISCSEEVAKDRFIMSWAVHLYRSAAANIEADAVLNKMNVLGMKLLGNLGVLQSEKEA